MRYWKFYMKFIASKKQWKLNMKMKCDGMNGSHNACPNTFNMTHSPKTMKFNAFISARKSFRRINSKVCWNEAAFGWILSPGWEINRLTVFLKNLISVTRCFSICLLFSFSISFHCIKYPNISMNVHFNRTSFSIQWLFQYSNMLRFIYNCKKNWKYTFRSVESGEHTHILLALQLRETIMLVVTFPLLSAYIYYTHVNKLLHFISIYGFNIADRLRVVCKEPKNTCAPFSLHTIFSSIIRDL